MSPSHCPATENIRCQSCGGWYNSRGLKQHETACRHAQEIARADQKYEDELRRRKRMQSMCFTINCCSTEVLCSFPRQQPLIETATQGHQGLLRVKLHPIKTPQ